MAKSLKLKNNSARPVVLMDGTLLTPGQVTEVSPETAKMLKEGKLGGPNGPTLQDSLMDNHDIEVVRGDSEDATEVDNTALINAGGGSAGSPSRGTGLGAPPKQDLPANSKKQDK